MKIIGVYEITNVVNGKHYFGSSNNIKRRWIDHKKRLRHNTHDNCYLQRSWNKHGEKSFIFSIVEVCNESDLLTTEQKYIDDFKKSEKLYNLSLVAGKIEMNSETRKRIGDGNRGKIRSKETKKLLSDINSGSNHPMFGKTLSIETRKKLSMIKQGENHPMFGKKHTEETKRKMSDSHKGNNHLQGTHQSDESKKKKSQSMKKFYENDVVKKLHGGSVSEGYKNMSEENRQKHRDNIKKSWVLRKLKKEIL
jgi:group I intron endonuclease